MMRPAKFGCFIRVLLWIGVKLLTCLSAHKCILQYARFMHGVFSIIGGNGGRGVHAYLRNTVNPKHILY